MYNSALINKCREYDFKSLFEKKGYKYFEIGDYNLNIIGVRDISNLNQFNDCIVVDYKIKDEWNRFVGEATTDPGTYYLKNKLNANGCALMKEGQHLGVYQTGLHSGYSALVQRKELPVYRVDYINNEIKINKEESGFFQINIHKAGSKSIQVDKWSAGCQVFAKEIKFNVFMELVKHAKSIYGNSFTYTLINSKDLIDDE
jgi:hypothetical protein